MTDKQVIAELFTHFKKIYDASGTDSLWENQSAIFKTFWKNKVMGNESWVVPADSDVIVRLLDGKARGHKKEDVTVANLYVYQNRWDDIFSELKKNPKFRNLLNGIFEASDNADKARLIDELRDSQKLGLTGAAGNALNGLLFLHDPAQQFSVCSMKHRNWVIEAFGFEQIPEDLTYGERIIATNESLLHGFREQYGLTGSTRSISEFLYHESCKDFWQKKDDMKSEKTEVPTRREGSPIVRPPAPQSTGTYLDYVPPIIADLVDLTDEKGNGVEFENKVSIAFKMLGFEVRQLGQGTGRNPDGIACLREMNFAIIYDAKSSQDGYSLGQEDRKFIEYIQTHERPLRKEGYRKLTFAIVAGKFRGDGQQAITNMRNAGVYNVTFIAASQLIRLVAAKVLNPLQFDFNLQVLVDLLSYENGELDADGLDSFISELA